MALQIEQFTCRSDNFGVLVHDPAAGLTAAIDAPQEAPIRAKLKETGWRLTHIFTTHHHGDHVEGNLGLKADFGCLITGPAAEAGSIPGIDSPVKGGDSFSFGDIAVQVIDTPGHTLGHVCYWLPSAAVAFAGDTLFAMGCGRVFEGTPEMMFASLEKLRALPDRTAVYCGHEYTETNARFALTVDPGNGELIARYAAVKAARAAGQATLPTTIALEKKTNPYFRTDDPAIRKLLGMEAAAPAEVFAEIRKRKDNFR
jgi:hydroxyacylglutathione hydrolase